jgi:ADP-heptose:LPS heptosyltransferase
MKDKILWIALFRGIGDTVLFYPTLKYCRATFPDTEIDILVVREGIAEVLRLYGFTGKVYILPKTVPAILRWIFMRGFRRYGKVFDASSIEQMHLSRWITWLCSSGDRTGYHLGSSSWLYNKRLNTAPIADYHQKDIYAELLRPFADVPSVAVGPPHDSDLLRESLRLPSFDGTRIVVHAGARDPSGGFVRSWMVDRYVELIAKIAVLKNVQIVIIGSDAEKVALAPFSSRLAFPNVTNIAGDTSLARHFSIIKSADLFLGNTSGAYNIAIAYGKPIVTFAGGISMKRWGPPPDDKFIVLGLDKRCPECTEWHCEEHGIPCMEAVTVDEAYEAVARQIEKLRNR